MGISGFLILGVCITFLISIFTAGYDTRPGTRKR
ncbi:hypothetical protein BACCIP111883_02585 [Sutcliffiella rhizosphaerae]|uniref:Uncharacterized protein n=1 Tax=Sutcliffiella rhizosphaerae TaxID=2880967 RepID=A0ABM8YPH1_9BACI|nr:hypothetical protein BACCIP111883_02585 [Sutcliffiella rhizosphaerae]